MTSYLHAYNPQWPQRYQQESELIKGALIIDLRLFHIGSTAIKDLYAKDCIDILGVIDNFQLGEKIINSLEILGYEYRGEYGIKGRHYFSKTKPDKIHLHIFAAKSEEINKHLHFVKVMSKDAKLVEELNLTKRRLFELYPHDKAKYQQEKAYFYEKILAMSD
jgi:GrpB-like predicted nucleotidyltransferase (UPF0157 family)